MRELPAAEKISLGTAGYSMVRVAIEGVGHLRASSSLGNSDR
jgi:hypothetical protein